MKKTVFLVLCLSMVMLVYLFAGQVLAKPLCRLKSGRRSQVHRVLAKTLFM